MFWEIKINQEREWLNHENAVENVRGYVHHARSVSMVLVVPRTPALQS